ncbi:MAG: type II toxin-antitoxin system HicB family antitoxin [Candidatus Puniceispirillaceae bacterium]
MPVIIDKGRPRRINISLDAGLLEAIDQETNRRGMTRSAFLSSAARREITQT